MPFKLTLNDSGAFASLRSEAEKAQENCESSFFGGGKGAYAITNKNANSLINQFQTGLYGMRNLARLSNEPTSVGVTVTVPLKVFICFCCFCCCFSS